MKMQAKTVAIVLISMVCFSCSSNPFSVDVSNIEADVEVKRFDKELFDKPADAVVQSIPELKKKYGYFFDLYTTAIVPLGGEDSSRLSNQMRSYLSYPTTIELAKEVEKKFSDFSPYETKIENGFKHFKYYFPDIQIPVVYTCVASLNYPVFVDEGLLGIGLDLYLGEQHEVYTSNPDIHQYLLYRFKTERLPLDCMEAWINMEFQYNDSIDNVVNNMIYQGRQKYFLNALFPDTPAAEIVGYTPEQWQWCEESETMMWAALVEKKVLFSSNPLDITKLISEAPFTKYFPQTSPGRAGIWIGYRIIESYIKNNSNVSLQQLMLETDYQKILNNSGYNP